ncbi:putative glycoside hydrolase [Patescibacteria group bacterium]|nr:putative glycoside hydrolase [Patescibacteria group bacterium]
MNKKLKKIKKQLKRANWLYLLLVWTTAMLAFNIIFYFINHDVRFGSYLNSNHESIKIAGHIKKPGNVKGIYITAYTAGISRFDELIDFVKANGLNTIVLDVKGPNGEPAFFLKRESLKEYNPDKPIFNVSRVIEKLHDNNIYAIARIFVFQDPYLVGKEPQFALHRKGGGFWTDYKGVKWLDPTHFGVWKYNADFAREAYEQGFDEVQFDYIRFPSDGNLATIEYTNWDGTTPKEVEMEEFFKYMSRVLRGAKIPSSADLFGLVCCYDDYDLGIGQKLERALPYFDFISPMMYPSHYADGFIGYANPASHPYGVVKYSMEEANRIRNRVLASSTAQMAELRPWIQDFDIGDIYDTAKVRAQIQAIEETNGEGFLIWNARNVYTSLR